MARAAVRTDKVVVARVMSGLQAVASTLATGWTGAVVTGPRKPQLFWESSPPEHGRVVAASLKAMGADPFYLPPSAVAQARGYLRTAHSRAVQEARRTGRDKSLVIRAGVEKGAKFLVAFVKYRIVGGYLGTNSAYTKAMKSWAIAQGWISSQYGNPPPFGIFSGRFLASIKSRVFRSSPRSLPAGATVGVRYTASRPVVR